MFSHSRFLRPFFLLYQSKKVETRSTRTAGISGRWAIKLATLMAFRWAFADNSRVVEKAAFQWTSYMHSAARHGSWDSIKCRCVAVKISWQTIPIRGELGSSIFDLARKKNEIVLGMQVLKILSDLFSWRIEKRRRSGMEERFQSYQGRFCASDG